MSTKTLEKLQLELKDTLESLCRTEDGGKTIEAVRKGKWKLLQNSPFAPLELYDLEADPKETTDLAAKEKKVLAEMSAALRKHVQRGGQVESAPARSDDRLRTRLARPRARTRGCQQRPVSCRVLSVIVGPAAP